MERYRFRLQCGLSMILAMFFAQFGRSQDTLASDTKETAAQACKVYSLAELGDDPKLCKWIAETIPEMIQPASWKQADAKLSYYAPSRILVINNTPAVHARVEEFLVSLRKTLPQKAAVKHDPQVMPAQFALQDPSRPIGPVLTGPASYPVPVPPVGPKHLFHFIIRYEGEGIIDANVAKFTKALNNQAAASSNASYVFPPPPASDALIRANAFTAPNVQAMPPADAPPPPPPASPPPIPRNLSPIPIGF